MRPSTHGACGGYSGERNTFATGGWIPSRAVWQAGELCVEWAHLGEHGLREPFFEQTIELCMQQPFNQLFRHRTPIAALAAPQQVPALQPDGFIFHMSRCGSTLVSQMLAALPQNIVISEASPIDTVLRAPADPARGERRAADPLAAMDGRRTRPAVAGPAPFLHQIRLLAQPGIAVAALRVSAVPWIFLYRDPVEVLVSQARQPAPQMMPGMVAPGLADIAASDVPEMPVEVYRARLIAGMCEAALQQHPHGGGRMINYRDLPDAFYDAILPHFRVDYSAADRVRMAAAAQRDAKAPQIPFTSDSQAKQAAAADATAGRRDVA